MSSKYGSNINSLPVVQHRDRILYALDNHNTIIVISETGTGKSTVIPQILHSSGWASGGKAIVCTQPRRIAAISVASRVAKEIGCRIGEEVGYSVRFDRKISPKTKIKYSTDGVLIREVMSDPLLVAYSVVMVDEAHERSLNTDVLLGLLKKIQRFREDLRVIVASATVDAEAVREFFDTGANLASTSKPESLVSIGKQQLITAGNTTTRKSCVLCLNGTAYPVDLLYLRYPARSYIRVAADTVQGLHKLEPLPGDILVFMPGVRDVDQLIRLLQDEQDDNSSSTSHAPAIILVPLHGSLTLSEQARALQPGPVGYRKIIVATSIAETSLTVPGVTMVVDTGFENISYLDPHSGVNMLVTAPASQASAAQRAGRCGRTGPGKCFRLMTEEAFQNLPLHGTPEMRRVDLAWTVLQLKALGIDDIAHFDFPSPPRVDSLILALEQLYSLGALTELGNLTQSGSQMAEMPTEPRVSKVLLESYNHGCGEDMLTVMAMCSVDHPFPSYTGRERGAAGNRAQLTAESVAEYMSMEGDHFTLLNVYRAYELSGLSQSWCDSKGLRSASLQRAKANRDQLERTLKHFLPSGATLTSAADDTTAIKRCLVTGFFVHVARLDHDGHYRTLRGGLSVILHSTSVYQSPSAVPPAWVLYNEAMQSSSPELRIVTSINPFWLAELAGHYYELRNIR